MELNPPPCLNTAMRSPPAVHTILLPEDPVEYAEVIAWCDLFEGHDVRIGVSIDGPASIHEQYTLPAAPSQRHWRLSSRSLRDGCPR